MHSLAERHASTEPPRSFRSAGTSTSTHSNVCRVIPPDRAWYAHCDHIGSRGRSGSTCEACLPRHPADPRQSSSRPAHKCFVHGPRLSSSRDGWVCPRNNRGKGSTMRYQYMLALLLVLVGSARARRAADDDRLDRRARGGFAEPAGSGCHRHRRLTTRRSHLHDRCGRPILRAVSHTRSVRDQSRALRLSSG